MMRMKTKAACPAPEGERDGAGVVVGSAMGISAC
jgi:hypothetical protein